MNIVVNFNTFERESEEGSAQCVMQQVFKAILPLRFRKKSAKVTSGRIMS